jgi:hypothetical protein
LTRHNFGLLTPYHTAQPAAAHAVAEPPHAGRRRARGQLRVGAHAGELVRLAGRGGRTRAEGFVGEKKQRASRGRGQSPQGGAQPRKRGTRPRLGSHTHRCAPYPKPKGLESRLLESRPKASARLALEGSAARASPPSRSLWGGGRALERAAPPPLRCWKPEALHEASHGLGEHLSH